MTAQESEDPRPPQEQEQQPGRTEEMEPKPRDADYRRGRRLLDRNALITGGDSGIGRAVAVAFAREGADVSIVYLSEHEDAEETEKLIEAEGRRCLLTAGDIGDPAFCATAVQRTLDGFGGLDVLVNNAAEQHVKDGLLEISAEQLERTFRTNFFGMFYMIQSALPHLKRGSTIVNTTSVTAYQGHPLLIDYSATKGAIAAFTRSLSASLAKDGIRVNGVAPGPIWTPLIPASFDAEQVKTFGTNTPMGRAGEPDEVAPCYVFLASEDSAYMSGQVLHPNGGQVVNG